MARGALRGVAFSLGLLAVLIFLFRLPTLFDTESFTQYVPQGAPAQLSQTVIEAHEAAASLSSHGSNISPPPPPPSRVVVLNVGPQGPRPGLHRISGEAAAAAAATPAVAVTMPPADAAMTGSAMPAPGRPERRPCRYERLPLMPLFNESELQARNAQARAVAFAGIRRFALPPAPSVCAARIAPGRVVLQSQLEPHQRFLAAFPAGGEVFAIGTPSRMDLTTMMLEVFPAAEWSDAPTSPWVMLRHAPTGNYLEVVPPGAAEGAWMVRLSPRIQIPRGRGELFCIDPSHGVYSHAARGYVNVRNGVLLRGHDRPNTPAGRVASSRIAVLRVPESAIAIDAEYWRCVHAHMPGTQGGRQGGRGAIPQGRSPHSPVSVSVSAATVRAESVGDNAGSGTRRAADGPLHVLTYATKATPMLCDALLVALVRRVPLTLIGFGDEYRGNFQKLTGAREVVGRLRPDALVLFADAYDVLYAASAEELTEGFQRLRVPPDRVLFMAERGCWPDWDMGPPGRRFCTERYPSSPTPYRYVNSGVWMGHAAAAFRLLTILASYTPGLDDQHVTGHLFVDRPGWFALDRNATLLQSMGAKPFEGDTRLDDSPERRVVNTLTNTTPKVLHFNGGAKGQFGRYRDHLLSRVDCLPIRTGRVATPDGELAFQAICPRHPLPAGRRAC